MITLIAIFSSDPGGCFARSPRWGAGRLPPPVRSGGSLRGEGGFSPHSCDAERRSLGWATRTGILSLYSHFRAMSPPLGEIMPLHERYGVGFPLRRLDGHRGPAEAEVRGTRTPVLRRA